MHTMNATFTWAQPVDAAPLIAHTRAYVDTLPALNALRACNRFGKGPHCQIRKLPVELVQAIANYHVLKVRKKELKKCKRFLRCSEDNCTLLDHFSRKELLVMYHEFRHECSDDCCGDFPDVPSNAELVGYLEECEIDEDNEHFDNRNAWVERIRDCLKSARPLLQKHFGIDIWLSFVCLGESERFVCQADTTEAYLTLPDRVICTGEWPRFRSEDGYESSQNGCSMAVAMDSLAAPTELQNFKRTMRALGLENLPPMTASRKVLSLASTKKGQIPVDAVPAVSFPRPMLLVRNNIEGE